MTLQCWDRKRFADVHYFLQKGADLVNAIRKRDSNLYYWCYSSPKLSTLIFARSCLSRSHQQNGALIRSYA